LSLPVTIGLATALLILAVFSGWRGARPPNLHKGPRLMPWRVIMLLSAAVLIFVLIHLVGLLGLGRS